jgi:multidrug efflux pump subunit AcrA (membrane-fusion protein)
MQSSLELNTEPAPPLDPEARPRAIGPVSAWHRRFRYAPIISAAMLGLAIAAGLFSLRTRTAVKSAAHASNSGLVRNRSMRLKGTTEAVQMRAIIAPLLAGEHAPTLTITKLATNGSRVKQGEVLAEFDRQAQIREFIDRQAEYQKLGNQVMEEQAKEIAARAKDETEIKQAESSLSKAELEMQKRELLSNIDVEKAQEDLEEAQATLRQLRETFDLKRKAASAAIRLLEIQRDRAAQVMQHAKANADLMQIRSSLDGVVVLNTIWKQGRMGEVQEGDQVEAGVSFMQVVDPTLMQVRTFANQEDFLRLEIGQTAKVHLDAYPELVFSGRLEEMAPVARSGDFSSKLRAFTVIFSISGNDAKLMPDLSAAVDVDRTLQGSAAGTF